MTTAGELLQQRQCTPQCLLALHDDPKSCDCRCGGRFHGTLADVAVMVPASPWWRQCHNGGWSDELLDEHVRTALNTRQEHRFWKDAKQRGDPYLVVGRAGKSRWRVEFDAATTGESDRRVAGRWALAGIGKSRHGNGELTNEFLTLLLKRGRSTMFSGPPNSHVSVLGVKDHREATVIAALIGESWCGEQTGTVRAIAVLQGASDPYS